MNTKIHTRYRNAAGELLPSATTIISILEKPALLHWAWQCGVDGEDYRKVRDTAATIGTIAHYMIECEIKGESPDLRKYAPDDVDQAENAYLGWLDFRQDIHIHLSEHQLISEKYQYGGTIDVYAEKRGRKCLIDLKTGSGVYPEMRLQVAAYRQLLEENGYTVDDIFIVHISKDTGELSAHRILLTEEWRMFELLREVYRLKKKIWK